MKTYKLILTTLIFSLIICFNAQSQNETGVRFINQPMFEKLGLWYEQSNSMYEERFPIIRSIPPISTDMPLEILLGYLSLDSTLRFGTDMILEATLNSMTSMNDTIAGAIKYLYLLKDYNPTIFKQYAEEVWLHKYHSHSNIYDTTLQKLISGSYIEKYRANLDKFVISTTNKYKELIPADSERKALYSMAYADYILRVEIMSVDSTHNKHTSNIGYRYQAKANVKEILKGQSLNCIENSDKIKKETDEIQTGICDIYFQFLPASYSCVYSDRIDKLYSLIDTNFTDNKNGLFYMKPGQEAIVFLTYANSKYDTLFDYFDLDVEPRCSLNALPIINETVYDVNHVWTQSGVEIYFAWKNRYMYLKNKIINMNY